MNTSHKSWSFNSSWAFTKDCLLFFAQNKSLLIIPALGLISSIIVFACLLLLLMPIASQMNELWQNDPQSLFNGLAGGAIVVYFLLRFINLFFNSVLLSCATYRLKQQTFSITQGFSLAFSRIFQIFIWSLVNSSVGMIINLLQRSHSLVRRLLLVLLGFSWSVVSYFVLPLIVMDELGPWDALKKSYHAFTGGWRKIFSVFALLALILIPSFAVIFGITYVAFNTFLPWVIIAMVVILLISLFLAGVLETIVNAALYLEFFHQEQSSVFSKNELEAALLRQES